MPHEASGRIDPCSIPPYQPPSIQILGPGLRVGGCDNCPEPRAFLEPVPKPPVPCAGPSCKMRKARGAWRTRRRVRERRATQRSDADRPSPSPNHRLRRHAAIYSVSSPWRSASTTPSSSFLVSGGMASATLGTRGFGTGSVIMITLYSKLRSSIF